MGRERTLSTRQTDAADRASGSSWRRLGKGSDKHSSRRRGWCRTTAWGWTSPTGPPRHSRRSTGVKSETVSHLAGCAGTPGMCRLADRAPLGGLDLSGPYTQGSLPSCSTGDEQRKLVSSMSHRKTRPKRQPRLTTTVRWSRAWRRRRGLRAWPRRAADESGRRDRNPCRQ